MSSKRSRRATQSTPSTSTKRPRRAAAASEQQQQQRQQRRSSNLSWLLRVYKGEDDWHLPIFSAVQRLAAPALTLYPGCHVHATASLVFPNVVYVDNDAKVGRVYEDAGVLEWLSQRRRYEAEPQLRFLAKSFNEGRRLLDGGQCDLVISACAGLVSEHCADCVRPGGHFLVSDAHFDARNVATGLADQFELVGVFDQSGRLLTDEESKSGHFETVGGGRLTQRQARESTERPRSRWGFRLRKEAMFYLFRRLP